ncbi:MAG: hypothetical protein AAF170_04305 [Bacteroidota bacterium]
MIADREARRRIEARLGKLEEWARRTDERLVEVERRLIEIEEDIGVIQRTLVDQQGQIIANRGEIAYVRDLAEETAEIVRRDQGYYERHVMQVGAQIGASANFSGAQPDLAARAHIGYQLDEWISVYLAGNGVSSRPLEAPDNLAWDMGSVTLGFGTDFLPGESHFTLRGGAGVGVAVAMLMDAPQNSTALNRRGLLDRRLAPVVEVVGEFAVSPPRFPIEPYIHATGLTSLTAIRSEEQGGVELGSSLWAVGVGLRYRFTPNPMR